MCPELVLATDDIGEEICHPARSRFLAGAGDARMNINKKKAANARMRE